jgi:Secretion system C-terminal sorting domain
MQVKHFILSFFILLAANAANATVYYITPSGKGSLTGLSWANARAGIQLQNTINAAVAGDEIWVAAGVYKPTQTITNNTAPTNQREKCFVMKNGVKVLGGFLATGTPILSERLPFKNKTILSGELQNDGNLTNNAYNVIKNYRNGLTNTAILDGFWIMNGAGGTINGSGMLIDQGSPAIFNCVFSENTSNDGGAISIANNASPKFTTCIIMNNTATSKGGAVAISGSAPTFANSLLFNNKATIGGAALFCNTNVTVTFYVCDIHGNFTAADGAFAYTEGTNTRFNLYNSIIWSNAGTGFIYDDLMASTRTVQNCIYPLITASSFHNVNENPLYTAEWDPDGADDIFGTEDDGLALSSDSPAVGLGNAALIPITITTDITGSPRISGTKIDAGAYEYQLRVATEDTETVTKTAEVFPNPAHDFVQIRTSENLQNANFTLFSSVGQQVINQKFTAFANDAYTVNLTDLPEGVYFYQIVADDRKYSGKISVRNF